MSQNSTWGRFGSLQGLRIYCFPAVIGLCFGIFLTTATLFPFLSSNTGLEGFPLHNVVASRLGILSANEVTTSDASLTAQRFDDFASGLTNAPQYSAEKKIKLQEPPIKNARIFCWILTQPKNRQRAEAVKATWAKRCDGFVFISSEDDKTLPSISAHMPKESRDVLWGKTRFAFTRIYETILEEYDWYLKADDDTYVVMENLRYLVQNYSHTDLHYFGHHFKANVKQGYMSGGAGYVLSREAVRKVVKFAFKGKAGPCERDANDGPEDVEMGICLQSVGVPTDDSRDSKGRGRFFPLAPADHAGIGHRVPDWYEPHSKYPEKPLLDCCSTTAISFHYVDDMYVLEYLIYQLKPRGLR